MVPVTVECASVMLGTVVIPVVVLNPTRAVLHLQDWYELLSHDIACIHCYITITINY